MADYIWTGVEDIQCEIEVEHVGDRRTSTTFKATARRILRDGLLPLSTRDGRAVEFVESTSPEAMARAKLFLDRRFGFGTVADAKGATEGMRLFALQRVPDELVIAQYGRYGCPVCKIGEPDEEKLAYWLEHANREHGYEVVSDRREAAPGIADAARRFRVIRLRHLTPIRAATASEETEVGTENE